MGNSEVGHLNLGAGRRRAPGPDAHRRRDRRRLAGRATRCCATAFAGAERVHLLGLVSDGGVHSSLEHLRGADRARRRAGVAGRRRARLHRRPRHAAARRRRLLARARRAPRARASARSSGATGRWTATAAGSARSAPTTCSCTAARRYHADSGEQAVRDAYERGETDEFIEPTLVGEEARIRPGDSVICFNFRPDRMREIDARAGRAGVRRGRGGAPRLGGPRRRAAGRALRDADELRGGLALPGRVRAASAPRRRCGGARRRPARAQLHVAETEKYPHVTYFFNGGEEAPLAGERRELVPSPRDVPTYDHKPQMSAREAAAAFVGGLGGQDGSALRDHQLRERRHGRPHRRDRGGGARDRDRRRVPRRGRRGGARAAAASASSRPTTATPTTCSSPTAAPTRRTR